MDTMDSGYKYNDPFDVQPYPVSFYERVFSQNMESVISFFFVAFAKGGNVDTDSTSFMTIFIESEINTLRFLKWIFHHCSFSIG